MKIIELQSTNVARLTAINIKPDGSLVLLGGNNGNGKSTVLDSIMMALAGGKAIPDKPIHDGKDRAKIELDLGELKITRTFDAKGSKLIVKSSDGGKYAQAKLNELIKGISLDPVAFMGKSPADQAKTLRDMLGLDFSAQDKDRKAAFDGRTDVKRDLKRATSQLEGMAFHEDAPESEQSVVDLSNRLQDAISHNRGISDLEAAISEKRREYKSAIDDAERARKALKVAEAEAEAVKIAGQELDERIRDLNQVDIAPIEIEIEGLDESNRRVRENARHAEVSAEIVKHTAETVKLTSVLEAIDKEKADAIASADLPIEGLGFDDVGLTYQGNPFAQASDAEKLRVSLAIALAMQPDLRVVIIKQGAFLDENSLRMVGEMAEAADAQVWVERVGDHDEGAIIIEDGMVREAVAVK